MGSATLSKQIGEQPDRAQSIDLGRDMHERIDQRGRRCVAMLPQFRKKSVANGHPEVGLDLPRGAWMAGEPCPDAVQAPGEDHGSGHAVVKEKPARRRRIAYGPDGRAGSPGANDRTISLIAGMICSRSWSS